MLLEVRRILRQDPEVTFKGFGYQFQELNFIYTYLKKGVYHAMCNQRTGGSHVSILCARNASCLYWPGRITASRCPLCLQCCSSGKNDCCTLSFPIIHVAEWKPALADLNLLNHSKLLSLFKSISSSSRISAAQHHMTLEAPGQLPI